jgi:DNA mismatch repair protein MutL
VVDEGESARGERAGGRGRSAGAGAGAPVPVGGGPAAAGREPAAAPGDAPRAAGDPSAQTRLATRRLRLAGELWGAYLLVEDEDRLLVIDQHAAHERVLYDEIRQAALSPQGIPVQGLLVPLSVDLAPGVDPEEAAAVLTGLGFDARPGGPSSLLVDGIPGHLSRWGGGEFLRELFASPEGAAASAEKLRDAVAKTYSCRGAVKFNQRLHREEIDHLLRGLERTDVPRLCPHGRPIYLEVRRAQIDDRFERT